MVLTDEERKAKKKEYSQRPEVKARKKEAARKWRLENKKYMKEYASRPEVKERIRERQRQPKAKERVKKYNQRPEVKIRRLENERKYFEDPERRAKKKERESSLKYITQRKEYASRPEVKKTRSKYHKEYLTTAKGKQAIIRAKERSKLPESRQKRIEYAQSLKFKVFTIYSKRASDSEVPCCACCGENNNLDFLTMDHIDGRKFLPLKEQELTGPNLWYNLKKNDYPSNYQVLCWNCNCSKGFFGSCPHTRK